jgi:hypothetical protein
VARISEKSIMPTPRSALAAVDQDEAAGVAVVAISVKRQGLRQREVGIADFVQRQGFCGMAVEGVDVDLVLEARDRGGHGGGAQLQQILATRQQFLVRHPQQVRRELVGDIGPGARRGQHIAAADIHFISQSERDGIAGHGFGLVAVHGDDARDGAGLA